MRSPFFGDRNKGFTWFTWLFLTIVQSNKVCLVSKWIRRSQKKKLVIYFYFFILSALTCRLYWWIFPLPALMRGTEGRKFNTLIIKKHTNKGFYFFFFTLQPQPYGLGEGINRSQTYGVAQHSGSSWKVDTCLIYGKVKAIRNSKGSQLYSTAKKKLIILIKIYICSLKQYNYFLQSFFSYI